MQKEGKNVKNVKKYWPITYRKVRRPLAHYGKVQYDGTKLNNVTLGVTLDTGHKMQETYKGCVKGEGKKGEIIDMSPHRSGLR